MYQHYRDLLVLMMWGVLIDRNKVIFPDVKAHTMIYASKSVAILDTLPRVKAINKQRAIRDIFIDK